VPERTRAPRPDRTARRERASRRGFLKAAAAGIGAGALTAAAPASAGRGPRPVFVLVHGANGNGASMAPLASGLALHGCPAVPVDLPGHGPSGNFPQSYQAPQDLEALAVAPSPVLAETTLADNVDHVVAIVRRAARKGPVILVGHSMGGATITRVANEVPHLIARLVYVSAFCCVELRTVLDCFLTPEAATTLLPTIPQIGDPERIGVTRTNWRSGDLEFIAAAKDALAADYGDTGFLAALNLFEPDESSAVPVDDASGHPATWGRVPRTYVRYTADRAIPLALQDRMIAEADAATPDNRFDVQSLNAPHLGPENPQTLIEVLLATAAT
jgi:pimeloyl-ACP methyl ester carboxylesterase